MKRILIISLLLFTACDTMESQPESEEEICRNPIRTEEWVLHPDPDNPSETDSSLVMIVECADRPIVLLSNQTE